MSNGTNAHAESIDRYWLYESFNSDSFGHATVAILAVDLFIVFAATYTHVWNALTSDNLFINVEKLNRDVLLFFFALALFGTPVFVLIALNDPDSGFCREIWSLSSTCWWVTNYLLYRLLLALSKLYDPLKKYNNLTVILDRVINFVYLPCCLVTILIYSFDQTSRKTVEGNPNVCIVVTPGLIVPPVVTLDTFVRITCCIIMVGPQLFTKVTQEDGRIFKASLKQLISIAMMIVSQFLYIIYFYIAADKSILTEIPSVVKITVRLGVWNNFITVIAVCLCWPLQFYYQMIQTQYQVCLFFCQTRDSTSANINLSMKSLRREIARGSHIPSCGRLKRIDSAYMVSSAPGEMKARSRANSHISNQTLCRKSVSERTGQNGTEDTSSTRLKFYRKGSAESMGSSSQRNCHLMAPTFSSGSTRESVRSSNQHSHHHQSKGKSSESGRTEKIPRSESAPTRPRTISNQQAKKIKASLRREWKRGEKAADKTVNETEVHTHTEQKLSSFRLAQLTPPATPSMRSPGAKRIDQKSDHPTSSKDINAPHEDSETVSPSKVGIWMSNQGSINDDATPRAHSTLKPTVENDGNIEELNEDPLNGTMSASLAIMENVSDFNANKSETKQSTSGLDTLEISTTSHTRTVVGTGLERDSHTWEQAPLSAPSHLQSSRIASKNKNRNPIKQVGKLSDGDTEFDFKL